MGKAVEWMDSKGEEETLWRSMLDRPGLWVQARLPLRCTFEKSTHQQHV